MILDSTDCLYIRENEIGIYDTVRIQVTYSYTEGNRTYIRLSDGTERRIFAPKERIEQCKKK